MPVVYASSAAVYGANPDVPLREDSITQPISAYGADKLGCELHARVATLAHGVPTVGLRFFNVYGPGQSPDSPYSGAISIFAGRLANLQTIDIHGDGSQMRDFVYVGDVVRHLIAAMADPGDAPGVFNVCTGEGTTIKALANLMADLSGAPADLKLQPPRPGDIARSLGDPKRAAAHFGFQAGTRLAEGLSPTLRALGA